MTHHGDRHRSRTDDARVTVAMYIPSLGDGGAQRQCVLLANALSQLRGVEVILVSLEGGPHERLVQQEAYKWYVLGRDSKYGQRALWGLRSILARDRVDVVVSWIASADIQAFLVTRLLPRTRWIMTQRNSAFAKSMRHHLRDHIGRFASAIVSNSEGADSYWRKLTPRVSRYVVPNIVAPDVERTDGAIPAADAVSGVGAVECCVVLVGRLHPQKDSLRSVRALVSLVDRRPDVRVQIVGQGPLEQDVTDLVSESELGERIDVLGYRTDAHELIRHATVVLTLSRHEGMPNVVLESVALDTLLVASAIPEHIAILGADYPYYVSDEASDEDVASILEAAIAEADPEGALAHAKARVADMSGPAVAAKFAEVLYDVTSDKR